MLPVLTTARLRLEPLTLEHAAGLFAIFSSSAALQFWTFQPHQSPAETTAMVARMLGEKVWTAIHTATGQAIGLINCIDAVVPGMGYIMHPDFWRQGYGTEAVSAVLAYAFTGLAYDRVELWIDKQNIASQRLALKLGFTARATFYQRYDYQPEAVERLVFGLRASEWAAYTGQTPANQHREITFFGVHPRIPVQNVSETVAFYRDKLGFAVDYFRYDFAIVGRGEWSFTRAQLYLVQQREPPNGSLYIEVSPPIDSLYDEFVAKGVTIVQPPMTQPYARREFIIEDINGWRLTFGAAV